MRGDKEAAGLRRPAAQFMPRPRAPAAGRRPRPTGPVRLQQRLIEDLLGGQALRRAEMAAARWGVTPIEAAVALRLVSHDALAEALAGRLKATCRLAFPEPPVIAADPAGWRSILDRGHVGIVCRSGGMAYCLAARPADAERLAVGGHRLAGHGLPLVVMPPAAFEAMVLDWAEQPWLASALGGLRDEEPDRSAANRELMTRTAGICIGVIALMALALVAGPTALAVMAGGLVGLGVVAWSAVRLVAAAVPATPLPRRPLSDRDLPRYAILVALYREEAVAGQLIRALSRLDYPRAKLDILILTEADDEATRAAIAATGPDPTVRVITLPPGGPATKPRALALGLPLTHSALVVVYDAEDLPHPGQLREAAETFAAGGDRLGCLQAPLSIANDRESLLTRLFAAEYDGLFRVLLPALSRFGWPIPLGGTSNHFRRTALDQSLGWDPWNVAEDADLGFRLARNGWRMGTITLPTAEEAPARLDGWLGQRSRWFKGWLQTMAVLARAPRSVTMELGWRGALALVATLAGSLGSALVHSVCLLALVLSWVLFGPPAWALLTAGVTAAALAGSLTLQTVGLRRAGHSGLVPWLALLPVVWIAMGVAAWRAVMELANRPYHWEKTTHGLCAPRDAPTDALTEPAAVDLATVARHSLVLAGRVAALGNHTAEVVAAALSVQRQALRDAGADPDTLALVDAWLARWEPAPPSTVLPVHPMPPTTARHEKGRARDGNGRNAALPGPSGHAERLSEADRLDGGRMGRWRSADPLPDAP